MKKKVGKFRKFISALFADIKQVGKQLWEPLHKTVSRAWKFITKTARKKYF